MRSFRQLCTRCRSFVFKVIVSRTGSFAQGKDTAVKLAMETLMAGTRNLHKNHEVHGNYEMFTNHSRFTVYKVKFSLVYFTKFAHGFSRRLSIVHAVS